MKYTGEDFPRVSDVNAMGISRQLFFFFFTALAKSSRENQN